MLGIILLVMLSTGIYVAMSSALDRMEELDKSYDNVRKILNKRTKGRNI